VALLDRVPAHAALNHSVEWAKRALGSGAGGLVNAVLRRVTESVLPERVALASVWPAEGTADVAGALSRRHVALEDGRALVLADDLLPEDPEHRLAGATGCPRAVLGAWTEAFGPQVAARLALHTVQRAPVIINAQHAGEPFPGELATRGPMGHEAPWTLTPHDRPGHWVFAGTIKDLRWLLAKRPDVWVQDPASSHTVHGLAALDLRPQLVMDLCAGQGTKTRQLAAMYTGATVLTTDIDTKRRRVLAQTFKGHARVRPIEHTQAHASAGQADLVLLDVPCSNLGVLARRPEAKYRFADHSVGQLMQVQRDILTQGRALLKGPGAVLVYATCSLDPRENGQQAQWAAGKLGLRIESEVTTMPAGHPGAPPRAYHDGAYVAVLRAV
jgi:16S rRNA (cytosine967-C5)-methyltransferase